MALLNSVSLVIKFQDGFNKLVITIIGTGECGATPTTVWGSSSYLSCEMCYFLRSF